MTKLANFGEAVQARRLRLGLTQHQAASLAKVSDETWRSVQAGKPMSDLTLAGVLRTLQWPPDATERIALGEDLTEWPVEPTEQDWKLRMEQDIAELRAMIAELVQLQADSRLRS